MGKDLYEIGEIPPVGEVPAQMHAQLVRPDRFGDPTDGDHRRGHRRAGGRAGSRSWWW